MKKIRINKKLLHEIIRKSIDNVLSEGIEFDNEKLEVTYHPEHENNVETSEITNPTMVKKYAPNVSVYSIFKRKSGEKSDGNPLIYALKGEGGWHFKTNKDKNAIYTQMEKIIKKFFESYTSDVTVMVDSKSPLNKTFATLVNKYNPNAVFIENLILKMSINEIRTLILAPNSLFRKVYNNSNLFNNALADFDRITKKMGNYYRAHLMYDEDLRSVIDKTIKLNDKIIADYMDNINGKNILIIDDNIGYGNSVKYSCKEMMEYYTPKTITFLSLFSEKYNTDGTEIKRPPLNYKRIRNRRRGQR